MPTLRDVAVRLKALNVFPEEVEISVICFKYIMHRINKAAYEAEKEGDFDDDSDEL